MTRTGRHLLGPHVVGQRIVVRRVVRGETGPSGGPAMTDLLGRCISWGDGVCVVAPEAGEPVTIAIADIVSGKPVPPRPPVRHRLSPFEAQTRAAALFPDLETEALGGWTLRHSPTVPARRANSVLAVRPVERADALDRVAAFYLARGRRPVAAVLPGSREQRLMDDAGWVSESEEADTRFELAGLARASRAVRGLVDPAIAVRVEVGGGLVTATVDGTARGTAVVDGDWIGVRGLDVAAPDRRRGLGTAVLAALLEHGAEQGATAAYLQVLADNHPAIALYERLGFTTHHTYRYLTPAAAG